MIEFLLANQALIRETINGVASVLFFIHVLMIFIFLWDTWAREGFINLQKWTGLPGVPVACVLFWIFLAEAYRTFNVYLTYNLGKVPARATMSESIVGVGVGMFSASSVNSTVGYLFAGVVLCLALLRGIYIFSPPDWKRWSWIVSLDASVIFVSVPPLFKLFG